MSTLKIRKVKGLYGLYEDGKLVSDTHKRKADIEDLWLDFENHRAAEKYLEQRVKNLVGDAVLGFGLSERVIRDTIEYLAGRSS